MSEHNRPRRGDRGYTLPELLISIVITGTLVTAMASASTVILRQVDNSEGRLNNSRSEQNVGIWMPADLASAEEVDTSPGASPCGTQCPPGINVGGSNALMLSWTGFIPGATEAIPTRTTVSYRYVQNSDGEWEVIRVECYAVNGGAPSCEQVTVLHDVIPPPAGVEYYPGVTSPKWVMLVTLAIDPADPGDGSDPGGADPTYYIKNGRRVTVTINGGGDVAGAGGGQDQITLSAGGTNREPSLSTTNLSASPTFAATRSRCGGNFGLIVDTSGSIGSNMSYVRTGVAAFVDAFAGTPVKLQVVRFSSTSSTLGSGAGWSKYYDMLNEGDVAELKGLVAGLSSNGGTNWEDGFFRMFRTNDGSVQQVLPSTLIFFTDGIPTYSRLNSTSATASPAVADNEDSGLPTANGSSYNQVSWNRANRVIRQFEVDLEKLVGVYVGTDVNGSSTWRDQGAGYHLTNFLRGYHVDYLRGYHAQYEYATTGMTYQYASSGMTYQYATTGVSYERYSGGVWSTVSLSSYFSNNTTPDSSDDYRVRVTGTPGGWTNFSSSAKSTYDKSNSAAGQGDGFRVNASSPGSWSNTTKAYYDLNNTVAGSGDGYRVTASSPAGWTATTLDYYNLNNTGSTSSDGFRVTNAYSAPFDLWETTTEALYNSSNTTADATDGWNSSVNYGSPYSLWEAATEAAYTAGNTAWGTTDGWDATKVYLEPYTFHEASTSYTRQNRDILKQIIAPGGVVPAQVSGGVYTNAKEATYYELPDWNQFSGAMTSMALAECGGTVTIQTRVGASSAADPFTYQNSVDKTTATTSQQFRSGTFDYDLGGGGSVSATISPVNLSNLSRYVPVSWSCKSAGADYPFTVAPVNGGPWQEISLTVSPNQAISCIQTVALT